MMTRSASTHLLPLALAISLVAIPLAGRGPAQTPERPVERVPPTPELADFEALLYQAIIERLGIPYRDGGTDDDGYDCSGLIWRVFTTAGIEMKRTSARILWEELPEARDDEQGQFGTLVFFNDLNHVGIVRDLWSFYHASTSQGVTRSFYSDYWGDKIIGYRRIPLTPAGGPKKRIEESGGREAVGDARPSPTTPPR